MAGLEEVTFCAALREKYRPEALDAEFENIVIAPRRRGNFFEKKFFFFFTWNMLGCYFCHQCHIWHVLVPFEQHGHPKIHLKSFPNIFSLHILCKNLMI